MENHYLSIPAYKKKSYLSIVSFLSYLFYIVIVLILNGCKDEPNKVVVPVSSVAIQSKANISSLKIDSTLTLVAAITPANATNKSVTWSSSDSKIATVDKNGIVTGAAKGEVTIIVTTQDGNKKDSVKMTIIEASTTGIVPVSSVAIQSQSGISSLKINSTLTLVATIAPADATNKSVTWSSSDLNIATVDTNGIVTGVAVGDVTITATTQDGNKTANITLKITNADVAISVEKIEIELIDGGLPPTQLGIQNTVKLKANITPSQALNTSVVWSSSDLNIATVDTNGIVTGVAAGEVTIIAATQDGNKTDSAKITVIDEDFKAQTTTATPYYYISKIVSEGAATNINYIDTPATGTPPSVYEYITTNKLVVKKSAKTFTLKVTPGVANAISACWIDWNGDGYFYSNYYTTTPQDPDDELIDPLFGTPRASNNTDEKTVVVTIPGYAHIGKTKMRFQINWSADDNSKNPDLYPKGDAGTSTYRDFDVEIEE